DYYQPEAYLPVTDTFIEKETMINEEIDRLRLKTTSSLLERGDVVVVASVSCIYGIGSPNEYKHMGVSLEVGHRVDRDDLLRRLVDIHYTRNDVSFERGTFRVRGDVVEIIPGYEERGLRIEFFGNEIDRISEIDPLRGEVLESRQKVSIYPTKHFVTTFRKIEEAITDIVRDAEERVTWFRDHGKLLEAQRLESRTKFDVEMMREIGYCSGIENYSRYLSGRKPGERPDTLMDYFPEDFLLFIDESHVAIPQVRGMFAGDRSRKEVLVEYGFRLPAAFDNRPLYFEEFESMIHQAIFASATPADYELEKSEGVVVEQVIRPTGLLDPEIIVRPVGGQVDDLLEEIRIRVARKERVLVTTLTKRMSEDLSNYLALMDVRVRYLHSEIHALERVEILRDLRLAEFDVIVGINLLREGLDLPEVSLVAILDADKEGFLRSERALIQTAGRAARNVRGQVIMYADRITDSMRRAIDETNRRRTIQKRYNDEHDITPRTIYKSEEEILQATAVADSRLQIAESAPEPRDYAAEMDTEERIAHLEKEMAKAAENLEFERAAEIRDEIAGMRTP
ncbi:MAG: excinuclease ABC subunit UvrB, partial [Candidatus Latescibacteria bacterium]|nr:excinuclease ABC subunit UvrB [Candidatus Latescibacterota bacterium]